MQYITPIIIILIVSIGLVRKKAIYTDFINGAGEGLRLLADIFPPLVAMLTASSMLKASGALDALLGAVAPVTDKMGIPAEVMPLILIRPLSGSGAIGVLSDILRRCGADSLIGRLSSVLCGSTETTFYCLAVYLAKTRVKSIARAVPCAIIGDITGIAAAVIALRLLGL